MVKKNKYTIYHESDVTSNLSPNLKLVEELIKERIIPFSESLDEFLLERRKILYKLFKFIFRKKISKIKYKYLSRGYKSFEKFKTYRIFTIKKDL